MVGAIVLLEGWSRGGRKGRGRQGRHSPLSLVFLSPCCALKHLLECAGPAAASIWPEEIVAGRLVSVIILERETVSPQDERLGARCSGEAQERGSREWAILPGPRCQMALESQAGTAMGGGDKGGEPWDRWIETEAPHVTTLPTPLPSGNAHLIAIVQGHLTAWGVLCSFAES